MKLIQRSMLLATVTLASFALLMAQPPAGGGAGKGGGAPGGPGGGKGGGKGGAPRPTFSVTSTGFPDGGDIPTHFSGAGGNDNKSPAFEFHWTTGPTKTPIAAPDTLKSYAVIFHDAENSSNRTTVDTLHWSAFNIPGDAKGLPEGLGTGDLPDGTRNGPGINGSRPGGTPGYFGPGAGPGPQHHYIFEFYALDTKLDLPANTTRDELLKAMDTHVVGKAVYAGRFPAAQ